MSNILLTKKTVARRLLQRAKPYWWAFIVASLANTVFGLLDAGFVMLLEPLVSKGLVGKDPDTLARAPLFVIVVVALRGIAAFVSGYTMAWIGQNVVAEFRKDVFSKLLRMPASFFDRNSSGELLARITYNADKIARTSSSALTVLVRESAFLISGLVYMLYTNWRLTLFFFISFPAIAVVVRKATRRFRKASLNMQDAMGSMTALGGESLQGYQTIRVFGAEEQASRNFARTVEKFRQKFMSLIATQNLSTPLIQLLAAVGLALVLHVSLSELQSGRLTEGEFIAMLSLMMASLRPLKQLSSINSQLSEGLVAAESLFEILDEPEEKDTGHIRIERLSGRVACESLSYGYDDETLALCDVSFEVSPGQLVALVGPSGSGKSTLLNLLMRFYHPNSGRILLDGYDAETLTLDSIRRNMSLVSQQVTLFNDSVRNNICFGLDEIPSDDTIIETLKQAHAWHFVEKLPQGLDTVIGESGSNLSGGQRQRLAIARALLRDSPILLLDEATSALDSESERHIQAALDAVMEDRTTFVVAHRLSTIQHADLILVLDGGRLVERGKHHELLAMGGVYSRLHRLQFGDAPEKP
jgi:subfamily B ATP-binding cassette protein MsbA